MKRVVLWLALFLSVAIAGYAFLTYGMYAWLGATPNYPAERAWYGGIVSLVAIVAFLLVALIAGILLWKTRKR